MTDRPLMLSDIPAIAAEIVRQSRRIEHGVDEIAAEIANGTFSENQKKRVDDYLKSRRGKK